MSPETKENLDRAYRLIRAVTGEPYGDGDIVTDIGIGIAEPGYGDDETLWVLGNWNPKRFPRDGEPPLTREENIGPRLGDALEKYANADLHWLDEWVQCDECYRIFRTQPDSYSWKMFGIVNDYGFLCADHIGFDDIERDYVNDPTRALTFDIDLAAEGFVLFEDPTRDTWKRGTYESGWHPGQNDKPAEILARAHSLGWMEGIFTIPRVQQFDMNFQLWVRNPDE